MTATCWLFEQQNLRNLDVSKFHVIILFLCCRNDADCHLELRILGRIVVRFVPVFRAIHNRSKHHMKTSTYTIPHYCCTTFKMCAASLSLFFWCLERWLCCCSWQWFPNRKCLNRGTRKTRGKLCVTAARQREIPARSFNRRCLWYNAWESYKKALLPSV